MASGIAMSPRHAIKTRNAILRMKKCSPELRIALRQKCQERINNDRLRILNTIRKIKIQDCFRAAFGSILKEEWENIEVNEKNELPAEILSPDLSPDGFNLEEELQLEEILEKELLLEHENWLFRLYEELTEDLEDSSKVVCPLCCSGYLKQFEQPNFKKTTCSKCPANFVVEKSLISLQDAINECLAWHDKQCDRSSGFINVPKNDNENNLCMVCHYCSHLHIIE